MFYFGRPYTLTQTGLRDCSLDARLYEIVSTALSGVGFGHLFDDGEDVVILDRLDLVGKVGESAVDAIQLVPRELITQLLALAAERVPARVFAQHQSAIGHADRVW